MREAIAVDADPALGMIQPPTGGEVADQARQQAADELRHWGRVHLVLLAGCFVGAVVACGIAAPPMRIGERCRSGDLTVEMEVGSTDTCSDALARSVHFRAQYNARFGGQDLVRIPVRYRAAERLDIPGYDGWNITGHTYDDAIDLAKGHFEGLPHELNHVRTGLGHEGWCIDYEPWSEAVLGIDQRSYLGCAP